MILGEYGLLGFDRSRMIKARWKGRSTTTATDLVYVFKGQPVQDQTVQLHPNGNQVFAVKLNDTGLIKGRDYELNGDVLKLKAGLLSSLTASGMLGERAVLTVRSKSGADWKLHVLYADTPVLRDASGTTADFAIGTAFNGDRLATMEAVYADGSSAGPQNWTSFKEFAVAFTPSYETN